MLSKKCFYLPQHKLLTVMLTTNNIILIIILHFFSKASYAVFHIHYYKAIFKLRGFDFINYIFIQTQTNLAR